MAQIQTNTTTDLNLWELLRTSESGNGSSGAGGIATSSADIAQGINQAIDIDTVIARLTAIEAKLQGGFRSNPTITRAANVTPYTNNDVYGNAFELTNIGTAGGFIVLTGVRITFNISTLPSGMGGFVLFLYTVTPPSVVADNGAFSIPASDRLSLITPMGIDLGLAALALGGGTVVLDVSDINREFKLVEGSTSLFGYLITRNGFTPAASSETASLVAVSVGV